MKEHGLSKLTVEDFGWNVKENLSSLILSVKFLSGKCLLHIFKNSKRV